MSKDVLLRDYFAAAVLTGVMTNANNLGQMTPEDRADLLIKVSKVIYEVADAMLVARDL